MAEPAVKGSPQRLEEHGIEIEQSPRWVRVKFNGVTVADSKRVKLLRETGLLPVYYFPQEDVRMDLMTPTAEHSTCGYKGEASYWSLAVGDRTAENAIWGYPEPLSLAADVKNHVAFYWNRVDSWYEEEEQVFVHPRDPYKRVDVMESSRHVRIVVGGQTMAESRRPSLLFETNLPVRYYLPREDVRMDLLEATASTSRCPYKGLASYWKLKSGGDGRDFVWSYPTPIAECPKIKGLLSFFNERVDAIYVDDEVQPRPRNKWS